MKQCPPIGTFSVCERVIVEGSGYTYVRGQVEDSEPALMLTSERHKVEALSKDTPSIMLNLEARLRKLQAKGFPYSSVNRYFRASLKDEQVGLFDLKDALTYARGEPEKTYTDAYIALAQVPSTISMSWLYSVVEGMPE